MEMTKRKVMTGTRFLSFTLDNETYCIGIKKVKELMGISEITHIPQTPKYIRGVINLRGQIIPIIDLRTKFGLPFLDYNKRTCVIVVEIDYEDDIALMGIVVDTITEVIGILEDNIKKMPYINAKIKSDFITGISNAQDGIKIILDINKVLSEDELALIKGIETINNEQK